MTFPAQRRSYSIGTVAVIALLLSYVIARASMPLLAAPGSRQDPAEAAAFDKADRRARAVIGQIRCAQQVARLRHAGAFGRADSLGRIGQCLVVGDRYIGVFFDADTSFTVASRVSAVDVSTATRRAEPIDTVGILSVARASRTAQLRGRDAYVRERRLYSPVSIRFDGDSIEVWLIPGGVLAGDPLTVGGERGYNFSPDGRTLARETDQFDALRTIASMEPGLVVIPSRQRAVPTLTELVLANLLHSNGRRTAIDLLDSRAMLVGEGETATWVHIVQPRAERILQRLIPHVLADLESDSLHSSIQRPYANAWLVRVTSADSAMAAAFGRRVMQIVHGHPAAAGDSLVEVLEVSPASIKGDSAFLFVARGRRWCAEDLLSAVGLVHRYSFVRSGSDWVLLRRDREVFYDPPPARSRVQRARATAACRAKLLDPAPRP